MNKRWISGLLCAGWMAFGAGAAWAQDANSTFKFYWKDGLRGETGDGQFKFKIGGRMQYDGAFFSQDGKNKTAFGEISDGSEFRRARLEVEGTAYTRFIFKTQYDFAGGSPAVKDMYVGVTGLPFFGRVRIGQTIEPFSLDQITSSKYSEFIERGLTTAFAPDRNPGIAFNNSFFDDRMTVAGGVFRNGDDTNGGNGTDGTWALTGRVTGLPWYQEESKLLHVGMDVRYTNVDSTMSLSARPEAHLAPKVVDTGKFNAKNYVEFGPEAAFLYGPFSLQGEYFHAITDASASGDPEFSTYTVSASYWLTGESRRFKPDLAEFDRVKPKRNLFQSGGLGAWEAVVRYSSIDLTDGKIAGGKVADVTAGLNWQWNPNMRVMFDYIHSDVDKKGAIDTAMARFQVDF